MSSFLAYLGCLAAITCSTGHEAPAHKVSFRSQARIDVPANDAAYRATLELQQMGLITGPPFRRGPGPRLAIELYRAISVGVKELPAKLQDCLAIARDSHNRATLSECREKYRGFSTDWKYWFRVAITHLGKMVKLEDDAVRLSAEVDACEGLTSLIAETWKTRLRALGGAPFFPDVPVAHWAWSDVHELQDAGILIGYPGGSFDKPLPPGRRP